jgi:hypothetical protein
VSLPEKMLELASRVVEISLEKERSSRRKRVKRKKRNVFVPFDGSQI